jgi:hypothetical protein
MACGKCPTPADSKQCIQQSGNPLKKLGFVAIE